MNAKAQMVCLTLLFARLRSSDTLSARYSRCPGTEDGLSSSTTGQGRTASRGGGMTPHRPVPLQAFRRSVE